MCRQYRTHILFLFLLGLCVPFITIASEFDWVIIEDGIAYAEIDAPEKSILNDSKLTLVKIDPNLYDFNFLSATEFGNTLRTADCWAGEFDMQIVVNAGMYSYKKNNPNKGYLKNYNHINNPVLSSYYNAVLVSHPVDSLLPSFQIVDITCASFDSIRLKYQSLCQGMRMIDCDGNAMAYDKKPDQKCSMIIISTDTSGLIYIIFSRSPYTHQKMISFIKGLPFNLRQTVYLEGGPEASLYIKTNGTEVKKYGSYVSKTWANDDNDHFWELPNVIGIRKKSQVVSNGIVK